MHFHFILCIVLALVVGYIGIISDILIWFICIVILIGVLWMLKDVGKLRETYSDPVESENIDAETVGSEAVNSETIGSEAVNSETIRSEYGSSDLVSYGGTWMKFMKLPFNTLETIKPSLNHVVDSISGKNTPDEETDSDGNVKEPPLPKARIQAFLGKDASESTVNRFANVCFYLHTLKGMDPIGYKELRKKFLNK